MRVFIFVQHLLGTGHLRRMADLADCLSKQGIGVCLVCGGQTRGITLPDSCKIVRLPPLSAIDSSFSGLAAENGRAPGEMEWRQRFDRLISAFERFSPDVVIVETFPFGRRAFRNEILPFILHAKRQISSVQFVCSIRDILQPQEKPDRVNETVITVNEMFDEVWVHGDRNLVPLSYTFSGADRLTVPVSYTGYIYERRAPQGADPDEAIRTAEILVSAGGGAVGSRLYRSAIQAAWRLDGQKYLWRLRVGMNTGECELDSMRRLAPANLIVERTHDDFPERLSRCAVSVSQAGYNTCLDVLVAGCASVLVPFAGNGEREQGIRARVLEELGAVSVLAEERIGPDSILGAVSEARHRQNSDVVKNFNLDGASNCIALLTRLRRR